MLGDEGEGQDTVKLWCRLEKARGYFMNDRTRVAKYLFSLDAVLGILSIGGAALYGAAYSSKSIWVAFFPVFVPLAVLWAVLCYGGYKGLKSSNVFLTLLFWLLVVGHFFAFPVGTAFSLACIWLWRDLSPHSKSRRVTVAQQQDPGDDPAATSARQGRP